MKPPAEIGFRSRVEWGGGTLQEDWERLFRLHVANQLKIGCLDYDMGMDGCAALRAVGWIGVLVATTCAQTS